MQNKTRLEISEAKYIRSSHRRHDEKKRIHRTQRIVSTAVVVLCCVFLILGGIQVVSAHTAAYQIIINDEIVATVSSEKEAESLIDQYLAMRGEELGIAVVSSERLLIEKISSREAVYTSSHDALQALNENVEVLAAAVAICINGEPLMYVADEEAARQAVESAKSHYTGAAAEDIESVTVLEQVGVIASHVEPDQVLSADYAANVLVYGQAEVEYHFVETEGENFQYIAHRYELSVDDLAEANPALDSTNLQIGTAVAITTAAPLINVQTKRTLVVTEELAFETERRENYSMSSGEENILEEGKPGMARDTLEIIERNGIRVSETVVDRVVLEEPVTQVVERGTRLLSASRAYSGSLGSGIVAWPYHGTITSRYGPRSLGYHAGLDISGTVGDAIVAARDGTVISAGEDGAYGLCVKIDHGVVDGEHLVTLYAHMSGIFVNAGQTISKGELIGALGNTGRSTGPHLHFEVQLNGAAYDPLSFLDTTSINLVFGN